MTLTATVDITTVPTVHLTIGSPDGSNITAITLTRVSGGRTELTRIQPYTGIPTLFIDDVEAPWDTPVTYSAAITYAAGTTTTLTSGEVTVSPGFPWAIHPTLPNVSMRLDSGTFDAMGIISIDQLSQAAKATRHDIINSPYPVITRVGPRASIAGTMTIATVTTDEEKGLRSLLYDETPILIRIPASWGWNWENGFYAIGDLGLARFAQYGPEQRRTFTVPFQRVQPPVGDIQDSWGYPDLDNMDDYFAIYNTFADYSALYANVRAV